MRNGNTKAVNGREQGSRNSVNHWFHKFACKTADVVGSPWSFFLAISVIVIWGVSGPLFHYSDSWQLVINTGSTIVTFLMVFLIQNTQNRDAKTFHLKLDELIHAIKGARNTMINLEEMTDEELADIKKEFQRISGQRQQQRAETRQQEPAHK